jgi:hypothetical protein
MRCSARRCLQVTRRARGCAAREWMLEGLEGESLIKEGGRWKEGGGVRGCGGMERGDEEWWRSCVDGEGA